MNTDAEAGVLYAFYKRPDARKHARELTANDFTDPANRHLFSTILRLIGEGKTPDLPSIGECGGDGDAIRLTNIVQDVNVRLRDFQWQEHIDILRRATLQREAQHVLTEGLQRLEGEPAESVIDSMRQTFRKMSSQGGEVVSMTDIMAATMDDLEAKFKGEKRGTPTGIKDLDDATGGLHKGELVLVGARPAVGKSALTLQIALAAADSGAHVLLVNQEMSVEQTGVRMLARTTGIPVNVLRDMQLERPDDQWTLISDGLIQMSTQGNLLGLFPAQNIEQLRATAQRLKDGPGLDAVVVDYLQLLQTRQKFEADFQRLGYVSRTLKMMALELDCVVVAAVQVGRSADGDMPSLAELRGSGDLEQDADAVLLMHSPEDADNKWVCDDDRGRFDEWRGRGLRYMAIRAAKMRQGETGTQTVLFDPAHMLFKSIDRD